MIRTLRADYVAGFAFIVFGVAIFAISGDLPVGSLSFPGSGFLPKIVAALLVFFGVLLALGAKDSTLLPALDWSDVPHAVRVIAIAALAIGFYTTLGFLITMAVMLFALIALVERRSFVPAAIYSITVTTLAYVLFARVLKAPLPGGLLAF
ncbi:MAG: putative tricarboxylic transport rane protein [Variibacter sp.]|jgi:hypothetical protein|nr:putative tricarboxylic transport rane protein [Variibacter sp.]